MKYCLNCGRELFDRDCFCDKCKSTNLMDGKQCDNIIKEINSSSRITKKILLRNPLYKSIYDLIINKPKDNYCYTNNSNQSIKFDKDYFTRINEHTINKPSIQQTNIPKCPTCNSTNVKKISGTKRWVSVGLFGLASSNIGKTMECIDCVYKW